MFANSLTTIPAVNNIITKPYFAHLTERLVEREIGQGPDAGRPDGEIVENEGDSSEAEHDDLGTTWTTQLLTLQWEPDHEVALDGETNHVPD